MVFGRFIFLYGTDRAETILGCRQSFYSTLFRFGENIVDHIVENIVVL